MTRILIVEDEQSFSEPLSFLLGKEGYQTEIASDGISAIEKFHKHGADLILLDLMLPGMAGTEVCKQIRATSTVPIIMLTAKDDEVDTVVGLELGADDYVTKPYSARELLARIRAVLRRHTDFTLEEGESSIVKVGQIKLDSERHIVTFNDETVLLPLKEFELLEYLMRNAGRVLTRVQIIDRIWGSDYVGDTKTLDVHIKRLRSKFEKDQANPELIQTIRGLGYKMEIK
jgi:two-component system response regulator RegX3